MLNTNYTILYTQDVVVSKKGGFNTVDKYNLQTKYNLSAILVSLRKQKDIVMGIKWYKGKNMHTVQGV